MGNDMETSGMRLFAVFCVGENNSGAKVGIVWITPMQWGKIVCNHNCFVPLWIHPENGTRKEILIFILRETLKVISLRYNQKQMNT
jgi:hypothetical protein